jgi:ribosomal protein S2
MLRRKHTRLHTRLNGIRDLTTKPDAIIIIDIKREHNALA